MNFVDRLIIAAKQRGCSIADFGSGIEEGHARAVSKGSSSLPVRYREKGIFL
jgi:hypothetical protein